jgi:hypothetical protein
MSNSKSAFADAVGGMFIIRGAHLKVSHGIATLDEEPVDTGRDGLKIVVDMAKSEWGKVLWHDGQIAERDTGLIAAGHAVPQSKKELPDGWNVWVMFTGRCADDAHRGERVTFTSSSWGGLIAFKSVLSEYVDAGEYMLPIVYITSRERKNDKNKNVDVVFKRCGWCDPRHLDGAQPTSAPKLTGPTLVPDASPEPAPGLPEFDDTFEKDFL